MRPRLPLFPTYRHHEALRNGAKSAKVKRLAGHATTAMQEHYTHMGMEDAGRAAALIGRVEILKKDKEEMEKPAEN